MTSVQTDQPQAPTSISPRRYPTLRHIVAVVTAVATGALCLALGPDLTLGLFARGAAHWAGWLTGAPVLPAADGWELALASQSVLVTAACSATDFFLLTAALLAWHGARRWPTVRAFPGMVFGALVTAVPLTCLVNALRIIAVAQVHRWVTPHVPAAYDSFFHLLTGVAVFLPALIALNGLLEFYARSHPTAHA